MHVLLAPWLRTLILGFLVLSSPLFFRMKRNRLKEPRFSVRTCGHTVRVISILIFCVGLLLSGLHAQSSTLLQEGAFLFLLGAVGLLLGDLFVRVALGAELSMQVPQGYRPVWAATTLLGLLLLFASVVLFMAWMHHR